MSFEGITESKYDGEHADLGAAWSSSDLIQCRDGKQRRVESGTFPLAHGLPASMGRMQSGLRELARLAELDKKSLRTAMKNRILRLKGYGNAIVPQLAAEFVMAYMEG